MRDVQRAIVWGIFLGLLGLFVAPAAILAVRIADTWQRSYTEQILGAFTAICGGGMVIVAALVGAGLYVRLSGGGRSPRRADPPYVVAGPGSGGGYGGFGAHGGYAGYGVTPPALPGTVDATPPWGATGGGQYALLPGSEEEFVLDAGE